MNKVCTKCGVEKSISDFYVRKYMCKICSAEYQLCWQRKNKDIINEKQRLNPNRNKKRKERAQEKKQNKRCLLCGINISNRIAKAKYCSECRKIKKSAWPKENSIRYKELAKKGRIKDHKNKLARDKKYSELLTDSFIISRLVKNGFTRQQIESNPKLIEIQRLVYKIKRYEKHNRIEGQPLPKL